MYLEYNNNKIIIVDVNPGAKIGNTNGSSGDSDALLHW